MISVIIPYVENRGFLEDAVLSVCSQNIDEDIELLLQKSKKTQGANVNAGLRRARGEFIKILHDDDMLPPNSLSDLRNAISENDFVCGDQETFGDEIFCPHPQVYRGRSPDFHDMLNENQIYGGTTLYRKSTLLAVGGYDEELWTGEEYDLHLRLLSVGYSCTYTPHVVHKYRLHEHNKSYYMGPGEKKERREFIREIANRYNVSRVTMRYAIKDKTRKHI